jgi:hypothetical protein
MGMTSHAVLNFRRLMSPAGCKRVVYGRGAALLFGLPDANRRVRVRMLDLRYGTSNGGCIMTIKQFARRLPNPIEVRRDDPLEFVSVGFFASFLLQFCRGQCRLRVFWYGVDMLDQAPHLTHYCPFNRVTWMLDPIRSTISPGCRQREGPCRVHVRAVGGR